MNVEFLLTSLVIIASPGTGALVTLAAGLARGARASVVAAVGCTLGTLPHMLAAITGLAALLHASPMAFEAIKYVGVAYLLYMAWMTLRADGPLQIAPDGLADSDGKVIQQAVLANLLNPKLSIFFFAFLPQFIGPGEARPTRTMLELSLAFMAMTFAVFAAYGVIAASFRDRVLSRPGVLHWMRRAFAVTFVALAARLALVRL
ncbi:LysE family translocator [Pseudorhodoferax sp. Leaf265]|jgi:threonine/homoserine/homoserine lactone efflux protein|uniref:LysE family translocator n=1 Tax=Pseudorhodoferax sp. Leaf265 TaxID=1736315 RepID=UPI0006FF0802|nr:LysE family translocator [Pseudorhodoferax sp. Leaf265]KQP19115.1 lysine transporter LysE [Pseudorhodoferax sp. Leaf265]PZP96016.1 MAG: LysE family translocator [Variovorax paradoxus]PZQ07070.1 MAG: LysE family translocator [Variovorax paradoxus]